MEIHGDHKEDVGVKLERRVEEPVAERIEIILTGDVIDVGKKGPLLDVKTGFYRNLLHPSGMLGMEMKMKEERIETEKQLVTNRNIMSTPCSSGKEDQSYMKRGRQVADLMRVAAIKKN